MTVKEANLEPGWLAKELAEAASDLALSMPPEPYRTERGRQIARQPLDAHDARRLREKMAERYAGWTGRDLAVDLRV